jgi:hypothetical protein
MAAMARICKLGIRSFGAYVVRKENPENRSTERGGTHDGSKTTNDEVRVSKLTCSSRHTSLRAAGTVGSPQPDLHLSFRPRVTRLWTKRA